MFIVAILEKGGGIKAVRLKYSSENASHDFTGCVRKHEFMHSGCLASAY